MWLDVITKIDPPLFVLYVDQQVTREQVKRMRENFDTLLDMYPPGTGVVVLEGKPRQPRPTPLKRIWMWWRSLSVRSIDEEGGL